MTESSATYNEMPSVTLRDSLEPKVEATYGDEPSKELLIDLEFKKLDLESGWLGKFVGGSKNSPQNISFLVLVFIFAVGSTLLWMPNAALPASEFWNHSFSVITLILGYLFGKNT